MTVHLEKRDPARNQSRFYRIEIQPTLFGEWAVIREWGRIGFRGGQCREHWHPTPAAATIELQTARLAKEKRGYCVSNTK